MRPSRIQMMVFASLTAIAFCLAIPAFAGSVISIPVGVNPKYVAVNQTTNFIYVSNLSSFDVSVIDGATNTVVASVYVGEDPEAIDVNPITNMVYVATSAVGSVSVIDGSSNTVVATISGLSASGLAVNPTTNQIFVSCSDTNSVAVIDGATNEIVATVTVGHAPGNVKVNTATNLIYVPNGISGTISVIDGVSDTVISTFTAPHFEPSVIALDPITNRLFVIDANVFVDVLDASTGVLLATITTGGELSYVAMFQPGKTVLISYYFFGAVLKVSESSYAVSGVLKGGSYPYGFAVNRKTGKVYVAELGTDTVNVYSH